jgi:hypothetical protein
MQRIISHLERIHLRWISTLNELKQGKSFASILFRVGVSSSSSTPKASKYSPRECPPQLAEAYRPRSLTSIPGWQLTDTVEKMDDEKERNSATSKETRTEKGRCATSDIERKVSTGRFWRRRNSRVEGSRVCRSPRPFDERGGSLYVMRLGTISIEGLIFNHWK